MAHSPRVAPFVLPLAVAALAVLLGGCRTTWTVENRDTPVHVWLAAPELTQTGGTVRALVYVGAHKAIDGPVTFPRGVAYVKLAPLRMAAGSKRVSVVIDGGRLSTSAQVEVRGTTWIRATVLPQAVTIERSGAEFTAPRSSPLPW